MPYYTDLSKDELQFLQLMQSLGEGFAVHLNHAAIRYETDGFHGLVDMLRNAPHQFPDKASVCFKAAALAYGMRGNDLRQFGDRMLKACPDDERIRTLVENHQSMFERLERTKEAEERRAQFKVINRNG